MKYLKIYENIQNDKVYVFNLSEQYEDEYIRIFKDQDSLDEFTLNYINNEYRTDGDIQEEFEDKYEVDPDNFFIVNDTYIISNLSYAIKFWREQNPKRITTSSYEVETFKDVELEPYKDSKKYNI